MHAIIQLVNFTLSNQIKFICDTKIQIPAPMKEVKQKVMCQQDTKAAKSCINSALIAKKILNIKTMAIHSFIHSFNIQSETY